MQADRRAARTHSTSSDKSLRPAHSAIPLAAARGRARRIKGIDSPHRRWLWSAQQSSIAADTSVVLVMAVLTVFRAKDRPAPPPTLLLHEDERVVGPNSAGWCCPG
jgi:hypothetical protein